MYNKNNKKSYEYDGRSNPWEWRKKYDYGYNDLTFEEKIELWKRESKERNREAVKYHTDAETSAAKTENNQRRKVTLAKKNQGRN